MKDERREKQYNGVFTINLLEKAFKIQFDMTKKKKKKKEGKKIFSHILT